MKSSAFSPKKMGLTFVGSAQPQLQSSQPRLTNRVPCAKGSMIEFLSEQFKGFAQVWKMVSNFPSKLGQVTRGFRSAVVTDIIKQYQSVKGFETKNLVALAEAYQLWFAINDRQGTLGKFVAPAAAMGIPSPFESFSRDSYK